MEHGRTGQRIRSVTINISSVEWWFAPAYFEVTYFLKKSFLDSAVGFHFALHKAIYFYQIRVKVRAAEAARGLL